MKKLFGAIICAALFVVAAPTTFIKANDDTTDIPVEDNQTMQTEKVELEAVKVPVENGVAKVKGGKFDLLVKFPKAVDVKGLVGYMSTVSNGPEFLQKYDFPELKKVEGKTDTILVKNVSLKDEGAATLRLEISNDTYDCLYAGEIKIENEFGELMIGKTELNMKTNDLVYFRLELENPWLTDTMDIGFKTCDGSYYLPEAKFDSTDTSIVLEGEAERWDDNPWIDSLKDWPFYDGFYKYYQQKAKESGGDFTTFPEVSKYLWGYCEEHNIDFGGWGSTSASGRAFIARKPGTAYVTVTARNQSKTIKINVSNITEKPMNTLPSNLNNEYYSDVNDNVTLNLTKADKLSKDVFKAAKETGKDSIFNIIDKNGNLNYGWSFDGKKIKNTNVDVNLSINKNTEKAKQIEETIKQKDIKVLDFAHHGELPAPATIKMNVSDQYKDGQKLYLNYWDETAKTPSIEIQKDIVVKDGYVEFTIDHCSTYFLSTDKVSIVKEEINDNTDNDKELTKNNDKQTSNSTNNEVKNDKPQTNENVTTPNTGVEDNRSIYALFALTSLAFAGLILVRRKLVK